MTEAEEIAKIEALYRCHFPKVDPADIAEYARAVVTARRSHTAQIIPFRRPECQTSSPL